MCGIVGVCNLNGVLVPTDLLKYMTDIIDHRGPDGEGHYTDGPVGLGLPLYAQMTDEEQDFVRLGLREALNA